MQPVLYKYLSLYKKLDVPGIGNFSLEETPAELRFTDKQILPPTSNIRFEPVVHPTNNHFYTFLSREWGVEKVIAIRRYKEDVEAMMETLKSVGLCHLNGIGVLRNTADVIAFSEAVPSFAVYEPLPAERILRRQTQHTVLVGEQERVKDYIMPDETSELLPKEATTTDRWRTYAVVLAILAILIIAYYYLSR